MTASYPSSTESGTDIIITLTTIRDYIRWGASEIIRGKAFIGHGIATPLHEAAQLVFHALSLPPHLDDIYLGAVLTFQERQQIIDYIQQRVEQRLPVAYITHEAQFAGLDFYVDSRVLVPRSPIAELIEQGFEPWLDEQQINRVLDLCTGSGCIAIACAYAFEDAQIDAVDLSQDALDVAQMNRERHQLEERVNLYHSDLYAALPDVQYDLIVTNPPYVAIAEWEQLPAEFHQEPEMGFTGGENGLDLVLKILVGAPTFLTPQGILVVEVGSSAETLQDLFPEVPFCWLDFERGGDGVFLLTAEQVSHYHPLFVQQLSCLETQ
jgi:ribosomal protein L3 glutamine methyltransferase